MSNEPGFVTAAGVETEFDGRKILRGIDLEIRRGEIFVIMGPSGCGKTTMMRHLSGLMPPTQGRVAIDGLDLYGCSREELDRTRRLRTGMSFQGGALIGGLTVEQNVMLPLVENTDIPECVARDTALMKLDMVGLLHAAQLRPANLSGGMRKRAAIARAIALDPDIVFFDEPSAGLDPVTAADVDNLICRLNAVFGITMIVVTHDLPSAYEIADRIAVFFDGRVALTGTRDEVWGSTEPRIRAFIERRAASDDGEMAVDVADYLTI